MSEANPGKVVLATGNPVMDDALKRALADSRVAVAGAPVYYREALERADIVGDAGVVILSAGLDGTVQLDEVMRRLRRRNLRVVLLAGSLGKEGLKKARELGVYDILPDPVSPEDIVRRLLSPATFAEAEMVELNFDADYRIPPVPSGGSGESKQDPAVAPLPSVPSGTMPPADKTLNGTGRPPPKPEPSIVQLSQPRRIPDYRRPEGPGDKNNHLIPIDKEEGSRIRLLSLVRRGAETATAEDRSPGSGPNRSLELVFAAPTRGCGATTVAIAAARALSGRCDVVLVDGDFKNPGLSFRLGMPVRGVDSDWRHSGLGAMKSVGGMYLLPLDMTRPDTDDLRRYMDGIRAFVPGGVIVIDAGQDPHVVTGAVKIGVINGTNLDSCLRIYDYLVLNKTKRGAAVRNVLVVIPCQSMAEIDYQVKTIFGGRFIAGLAGRR
jgi:CheY-like chemotaxis protein